MSDAETAALLRQSVARIKEALPGLPAGELDALRAAEAAAKNPRESLLEAIEAERSSRASERADRKAAAADKPPAWQAHDYTGPLSIDQANWRLRHLMKPAKAPVQK